MPDTMFSLFGEFSSQSGTDVHDTMIGWSYDNFCMLESAFKVAFNQHNTTLRAWLSVMVDERTRADELTLYILARMYCQHVYVFMQMFWWTTLLYTLPITEKELMSQCDIVLVYIRDGVFSELETIRSLVSKSTMPVTSLHKPLASPEPAKAAKCGTTAEPDPDETESEKTKSLSGITQSTPVIPAQPGDSSVTLQNTGDPLIGEHAQPLPAVEGTANKQRTDAVIPESVEGESLVAPSKLGIGCAELSQPSLPSIGVFLSKSCTILLVRCDFEQIKKTVELQVQKDKHDEQEERETQPTNPVASASSDNDKLKPGTQPVGESDQPEVRTSNRK